MTRHHRGAVTIALLMVLGACGRQETEETTPARTPAPPAPSLPAAAVPDTGPAADSVGTVQSALTGDSIVNAELIRLRAEVDELRSLADQSPDTAAPTASELVQDAATNARFFGIRMFWAIVVLVLGYYLIRISVYILDQLGEHTTTRRLFFKRLVPIVRLAVWAFAVYYVIAGVFQIDRTTLLAATAAVGVAIGLAAQDVLKNIFGGLIIILDRPFQVGDKIRVDNTYGEVVTIGLRATRIVTPDDNLVSVPNLKVVEGAVANANAGALDCQVVVDLFLPAWVDASEAKRIAYDAAATSRYVYLDKPIVVNVKDVFRETFLTHLMVKAYVLDTRYEFSLASDITETAKAAFRERGMLPRIAGYTVSGEAILPPAEVQS